MSESTLMLHCGAESATWDQVCNAPMPERTASYSPVPYKDMVTQVQERATKEFGVEVADQDWSFGLQERAEKGSRFFALCRLAIEEDDFRLALGLRGSTDKSMSNGFCSGVSVFVCDNMAFSGSGMAATRRHTGDAYEDFRKMLYMGIADSASQYDATTKHLNKLREVDVSTERGFELIGRAMGTNVLATQEASVALREWKESQHEAFEPRTAYSLYNAFTESAKKTRAPGAMFGKYSGIHEYFTGNRDVIDVDFAHVAA
jgi:hypothetical protein